MSSSSPSPGHAPLSTSSAPDYSAKTQNREPTTSMPLAAQSADVPVATVLEKTALPSGLDPASLPVAEVLTEPIAATPADRPVLTEPSTTKQPALNTSEVAAGDEVKSGMIVPEPVALVPPAAPTTPEEPKGELTPGDAPSLAPTVPELALETRTCPACGATLAADSSFCYDCGYALPDSADFAVPVAMAVVQAESLPVGTLVANRYEITAELSPRPPTRRYLAKDRQENGRAVVLVQQGLANTTPNGATLSLGRFWCPAEISANWPDLGWELALLEKLNHPCWPRVLDVVQEGHSFFVVEETASGPDLWQVFDDPSLSMAQRFELLAQLAEGLKALAQAGAIPEYLKPELLRLSARGQLMLTDLSLLVPLPYPARSQISTTPYTPPELVLAPAEVDASSPLYSFGAVLYALYLGHELTETDFERQWVPKPLVFRFPDAHPAYARLVMKTFVREKEFRFPTDEAKRRDATGWEELAQALRQTGQQLSITRLDVAGWSNIGKLRSNNEDAFALWHTSHGLEENLGETVLAVLCDGMGGYEAGEVAAAMAIDQIRQRFLQSEFAKPLLGPADSFRLDADACRKFLFDMLREVNQTMYQFSRSPQGKRGMGCTCELLYLHGQLALVAHVGDSRTYHYSDGQLQQLTRDQTLVNRLVELGQLTPEEAENHPRKNELQQALGAQPFVEPQILSVTLKPGDWLLLCSDGLTNHVDHATLTEMLQRADSAEMCARRLVNLANAYGGSDNTTVIAIRCQ